MLREPAHLDAQGRAQSWRECPADADGETSDVGESHLEPAFRLHHPRVRQDPSREYSSLRAVDRLVEIEGTGAWMASRHTDVLSILHDTGASSYPDLVRSHESRLLAMGLSPRLAENMRRWVIFQDGCDHERVRTAMAGPFAREAVAKRQAEVEAIVERAVETAQLSAGLDAVPDLIAPLPVQALGLFTGVPDEDAARIGTWTRLISRSWEPVVTDKRLRRAAAAFAEWDEYLRAAIHGSQVGHDSLISVLISDDRLSLDDVVAQLTFVYVAGQETTLGLLGSALHLLAVSPELVNELRTDLSMVPGFVEEVLRLESPVQMVVRTAGEPMDLGGRLVSEGDQVIALIGAANRDESKFVDPQSMRLGRHEKHLAFGRGRHFCLGVHLARLLCTVLIETMVRSASDIELVGAPRRSLSVTTRSLRSLPIRAESSEEACSHVHDR